MSEFFVSNPMNPVTIKKNELESISLLPGQILHIEDTDETFLDINTEIRIKLEKKVTWKIIL